MESNIELKTQKKRGRPKGINKKYSSDEEYHKSKIEASRRYNEKMRRIRMEEKMRIKIERTREMLLKLEEEFEAEFGK